MHFNLPKIFGNLDLLHTAPPKEKHDDNRPVADALDRPHVAFYNPDALHFPTKDYATPHGAGLIGNGGNITAGLNMIEYDHQATWNREIGGAGPVRQFFANEIRNAAKIRF